MEASNERGPPTTTDADIARMKAKGPLFLMYKREHPSCRKCPDANKLFRKAMIEYSDPFSVRFAEVECGAGNRPEWCRSIEKPLEPQFVLEKDGKTYQYYGKTTRTGIWSFLDRHFRPQEKADL